MPSSASVRRIAILLVMRWATSVPIVGSPSRSLTAATTGTARSAETVSAPSTSCRRARSSTRVDVREVDDLGHVCQGEPGRVRVPIDRDDAKAPLARLRDRAALVASRADEEDARHGAIVDARSWTRGVRVWSDRHEGGTKSCPIGALLSR